MPVPVATPTRDKLQSPNVTNQPRFTIPVSKTSQSLELLTGIAERHGPQAIGSGQLSKQILSCLPAAVPKSYFRRMFL